MPKKKPEMPTDGPAAMRFIMEGLLRDLGRDLADHEKNDKDRAQDLVYAAMEARTATEMFKLVNTALELDPANVDARLMRADFRGLEGEDRIFELKDIIAEGAKSLGKKAFKEMVPHFWGFVETRPYMRARHHLAGEYRVSGRLEEAALEYNEMLALNEHDNQGVRYELLPCLLALDRLEDARKLMQRFEDDCTFSVVFTWCRVLERHLSGDLAGAKDSLVVARKQNPHMEAYLKGHRKPPKNLPSSYAEGSKEEAVIYADVLLLAWRKHPGALIALAAP
jgi:tetratricopeptide (TPR) repeat protein